jgi:hypothetical protein
MPRGHRLPRDPISKELAKDEKCNFSADREMCKASRVLERNFVRKGDPN